MVSDDNVPLLAFITFFAVLAISAFVISVTNSGKPVPATRPAAQCPCCPCQGCGCGK